jgi:hypothetical protein
MPGAAQLKEPSLLLAVGRQRFEMEAEPGEKRIQARAGF